MAREERKISHKDTKTLRGREPGNRSKKGQKRRNRNFTQSRLPPPSRTPTLWRTGRRISPLAMSARDTKTLRGRESGNSPAFAKPTARQAAKRPAVVRQTPDYGGQATKYAKQKIHAKGPLFSFFSLFFGYFSSFSLLFLRFTDRFSLHQIA